MNNEEIINYLITVIHMLRKYHRHEVIGLENIPSKGRGLLIFNHSLATYDIALLFGAIYENLHRIPRPLADHLFFKLPYLGPIVEALGATEGTQQNAHKMLAEENLVAVAPGGMREALRPSEQRYQLIWQKRKGFVRLAIETQTPIILTLCPKADDLYHVYPSTLTKWAYKNLKIPLFIARGLGPTPIPRPIKLIHFVDEPIVPPKPDSDPKVLNSQINRLHKKIIKRAQALITKAIAYQS